MHETKTFDDAATLVAFLCLRSPDARYTLDCYGWGDNATYLLDIAGSLSRYSSFHLSKELGAKLAADWKRNDNLRFVGQRSAARIGKTFGIDTAPIFRERALREAANLRANRTSNILRHAKETLEALERGEHDLPMPQAAQLRAALLAVLPAPEPANQTVSA